MPSQTEEDICDITVKSLNGLDSLLLAIDNSTRIISSRI